MEILLVICTVICTAAACLLCFVVGAKVGQTVSKGEAVELPDLNPTKVFLVHKEKKKADEEQKRLEIVMQNIENYDGTPDNQKDVPRG